MLFRSLLTLGYDISFTPRTTIAAFIIESLNTLSLSSLPLPTLSLSPFFPPPLPTLTHRCTIDDRVTRVAWLNRSTILYAGNDKWSIDPRVIILVNTPTQYSIMIQNVDVYDEGPYTCSVQTDNHPKTSRVHLIVQGELIGQGADVPVSQTEEEAGLP